MYVPTKKINKKLFILMFEVVKYCMPDYSEHISSRSAHDKSI